MPYTYQASKKYFLLVALLPLFLLVFSCKHKKKRRIVDDFSYEAFSDKMHSLFPEMDTSGKKAFRSLAFNVRYTYMQNEYEPVWLSHGYKADAAADHAIDELAGMQWDGIDPEHYNLSAIKRLKEKLGAEQTTINDAIAFDTLLTQSYLSAASDLLFGRITPKSVDSLWYHANDSVFAAPALLSEVQLHFVPLDGFRSQVPTYALLRNEYKHYYELEKDTAFKAAISELDGVKGLDDDSRADISSVISKEAPWITTQQNDTMSEWTQMLTAYQDYVGIKPTGKLDSSTMKYLTMSPDAMLPKIAANLERVRWMQRQFGDLYILVNVPFMQLFFRKGGENTMHMRVVVGKPERQTPSLYATMANVVLNPPWGVPPTILKQDVLPGIEKSGSAYMEKKGLKAYDRNGKEVNVKRINAQNYKSYTYKQDPGDDNSLGYVKFNLPNPWDIYLHDTPHRGDFGKRERALSSGCVRLQEPQQMAVYILSELEKKNFTQENLDSIIQTHKTEWKILKNKIPVHIAYLTAFEDTTGKHILFARDVYHRDDKLISMLQAK